ncbi:hypothetical protein GWK47_021101 [Chionoecetes opilio]|uniref:Uncharacterized protein n=1 Tax=Chionoecetes opilio TaxID=41210 RepID=A0A8J4XT79_CHIOP|nr:hypothetical protein GWK47_021101 [Chionoecetes opilio]
MTSPLPTPPRSWGGAFLRDFLGLFIFQGGSQKSPLNPGGKPIDSLKGGGCTIRHSHTEAVPLRFPANFRGKIWGFDDTQGIIKPAGDDLQMVSPAGSRAKEKGLENQGDLTKLNLRGPPTHPAPTPFNRCPQCQPSRDFSPRGPLCAGFGQLELTGPPNT